MGWFTWVFFLKKHVCHGVGPKLVACILQTQFFLVEVYHLQLVTGIQIVNFPFLQHLLLFS